MNMHKAIHTATGWLNGATVSTLLNLVTAARPLSIGIADTSLDVKSHRSFIHRMAAIPTGLVERLFCPVNVENQHWVLVVLSLSLSPPPPPGGPDSAHENKKPVSPRFACFDSFWGSEGSSSGGSGGGFLDRVGAKMVDFISKLHAVAVLENMSRPSLFPTSALALAPTVSCFLSYQLMPQQQDAANCGVAVVVAALHLATGHMFSTGVDYSLWRKVLACLLLVGSSSSDNSIPISILGDDYFPTGPEPAATTTTTNGNGDTRQAWLTSAFRRADDALRNLVDVHSIFSTLHKDLTENTELKSVFVSMSEQQQQEDGNGVSMSMYKEMEQNVANALGKVNALLPRIQEAYEQAETARKRYVWEMNMGKAN